MITTLLLGAALVSASQEAAPAARLCPDGRSSARQNISDAEREYGLRSVAIVNAALTGDGPTLANLVQDNAFFMANSGDSGFGPGIRGPAAAIEFFRGLAPTDYVILAQYAGMVSLRPCEGVSTEVLLRGPDRSAVLRFRYDHGMLVEVTGRLISVTQGQLRRPPVD
jgi:hypothetical protein